VFKNYTVGFCFKVDKSEVALIKKTHPEWQKGLYNGIGGQIEEDESAVECMIREFIEEAGVSTESKDWCLFAHLTGEDFRVYCYACFDDTIFKAITLDMTPESIWRFPVKDIFLHPEKFITNLPWLIGMCLDPDLNIFKAEITYVKRG
jgi:8-oxo-dGTP diphosphatase